MVEKDSPNQEVTYGLADAIVSVGFRGQATCTCTCDDSNLTFTWNFGDTTTANGKNVSHSYGGSKAGNREPWLKVTCTCGTTADSSKLSVSAIDDIRVDRIGDQTDPITTNGRLCFNNELRVKATALPVGVNGSDKIDWHLQVGSKMLDVANNAGHDTNATIPELAEGDWPGYNSAPAWGAITLYISIDGPLVAGQQNELKLTGAVSYVPNDKTIRKFYNATTSENPTDPPNWFYYYKINQGGNGYTYASTGRSGCTTWGGGMSTVYIGNEAYSGDTYITHDYSNPGNCLKALGWSTPEKKWYANFLGVLAHETEHATNQTTANESPNDSDGKDYITATYETNTSKTDPDKKFSARGYPDGPTGLTGADWYDGECQAGGPVEKGGIDGAVTTDDWAHPGTNWNP